MKTETEIGASGSTAVRIAPTDRPVCRSRGSMTAPIIAAASRINGGCGLWLRSSKSRGQQSLCGPTATQCDAGKAAVGTSAARGLKKSKTAGRWDSAGCFWRWDKYFHNRGQPEFKQMSPRCARYHSCSEIFEFTASRISRA